MTSKLEYALPDQQFWDEYAELWANSPYKPVFKSPHYIQYLAHRYQDRLAVFKFFRSGKLFGAAFFRKEGHEYHMLTDVKADHNFLVIHKDLEEEDILVFFQHFLAIVKKEKWALKMLVQPAWASYMEAFEKTALESDLFFHTTERTVCPILEAETPEKLYEQLNASRELRYRVNRIKSQLGGEYEILTTDEDMDAWVEKFCELHIKRWEGTSNPSKYKNPEEQNFLKNCLLSWVKDKALARFSIKVEGERIAFVICLLQQNRLVHHSTAYDEEFFKYSPGKALILVIGKWMMENGLNVLDFGAGAESYKYEYTNKELVLKQIAVAHRSQLPFILKTKVGSAIRENATRHPNLKKFVKEKIRLFTLCKF